MRQIAAALVFAALATPALAQALPGVSGAYVQAYGGLRVPDNLQFNGTAQDLGIGTSFGASVGIDTGLPGVSADIDYMRSSANYSALGTALDSQTLMVDAQFAPVLDFGIKPYVAAGIGAVHLTYKSADSGTALGYQLKLGAASPLTDQISWFGEYRYQQALGSVNIGSPIYPVEYASHSVLAGLKFSFGGGASSGGYGY
jgi:opacity protein-like surface antigen